MRDTLIEMLTYRRPAGSRTERKFRNRWLMNLPGATIDPYRNIHVEVGTGSRTLWSCHTDTVHRDGGRQRVIVTPDRVACLPADSRSHCLGADDTVGVYLMREMILAGVPGYYLFHYGEERGGIGSSALAHARPFWFGRFDCAIAFDRQGSHDIVTHQFGGRTASAEFAWSLSDALASIDDDLILTPKPGVYTDTAEYADLIPECSNLSVGYSGQHSPCEETDLRFADKLLGALCQLDTSRLTIDRHPGEDDRLPYTPILTAPRRYEGHEMFGDHDGMGWRGSEYDDPRWQVPAGPRDAYTDDETPDDLAYDDRSGWPWERFVWDRS